MRGVSRTTPSVRTLGSGTLGCSCPVSGLAAHWGYHSAWSVSPTEPQRDAVHAPTACVCTVRVAPEPVTFT